MPGFIADLVADLKPAADLVAGQTGDTAVENAIVENVKLVVGQLGARSTILADALRNGTIKIVGGVYDLDTGAVRMVA